MIERLPGNKRALITSIVFALAVVNPFVEALYIDSPTPLMVSHYALAFGGGLIGYYYFRARKSFLAYLGSLIIVVWHYPDLYVLSAVDLLFRAADSLTVFVAGFLIGASVHSMRYVEKLALLILWLIGDTTLAVALLASYPFYSNPPVPYSPWTPGSEQLTGFVMMAIMMGILGFILFKAFRQFKLIY
ncbi:MAG: DUF1404 domain-containing protein [Sulfolobales archaeon]|nr:DUF1404 domain-containing protein [Sulfolobales archaeon]MCG2893205.1 DUF1404 domain-containing protein [Sulfolobales archaeon]MCG2910739.1 DUF1404 domain-containing protein [Sulfolobales archaeon]